MKFSTGAGGLSGLVWALLLLLNKINLLKNAFAKGTLTNIE